MQAQSKWLFAILWVMWLPIADAEPVIADSALVEKGAYLATAGNCAGCHTMAGGQPYAGGVSFKTQFGTLYSVNITPDTETGIGSWTEAEFATALREGVRPDGQHLYPAFPYTSYTGLSDDDTRALYAYLKTVKPVKAEPTPNELTFPFNQRWLMWVWNLLFFESERHVENASQSDQWNRGAYLVEVLGHCSACHTPRNLLGAEKKSQHLTGGTHFDRVKGGELRLWSAVDLTQSSVGLGSWSAADISLYLKTGLNQYAVSFGPMNKVIAGSTGHLNAADVDAMAAYLKSLPAAPIANAEKVDAQVFGQGQELYSIHCATCHLPTGEGSIETGPGMVGNPIVEAVNPASLINVILFGPELPKQPLPVQRTPMESYDHLLTDNEIAAIVSYMRQAWGNTGGQVSAEAVRMQR